MSVIITCAPTGGNPETGQPDPRPELFQEFMAQIKDGCNAVMNASTGGGLGMTREERLRAAVATSPEMASLNVGSHFGIFPMAEKYSEWKPTFLGHLYNVAWLIDQGWIEPPFLVQMVFGVLGGAMLGGNLRVGMEDSLYIGPGELTTSNAAQVRKIRGIVESLGYAVASPAEPRERLALKGAAHVTV
jgi:uncharacterized protein (DUF849 family)